MVTIEVIKGLEPRLYELVAPLVMDAKVLKQNRNYPFKTSKDFLWFIALDGAAVIGFLPVEIRNKLAIINNYYSEGENLEVLGRMIREAVELLQGEHLLTSATQVQHISAFSQNGFVVEREWKNYVKMIQK